MAVISASAQCRRLRPVPEKLLLKSGILLRRSLIRIRQTMHRSRRIPLMVAAVLAADLSRVPAASHPPVAANPYQPVAVKLAAGPADPSFATFRNDFAAVARGRVFERLARYVTVHGFFWDGDFANGFDPKKSGVENLAAAVGLERGTGGGWQTLADFAGEPSASETSASPGVLCAPARPEYDSDDFDRLTEATRSSPSEWVFPRATGVDVRAAPRTQSVAVENIGQYFVRVLRFETAAANADPLRTAWTRIAAPSGKIGYVAPNTLMSIASPRLCYLKDITGRWQIAGYIGRRD
jgi:hypothetical protein